jgi:predicted ATPase
VAQAADPLVESDRIDEVPHAPSPIVGREVELRALAEMLDRDGTRMVTITGPGGSGKTRLAIELAERFRREGAPVTFVDLTGLRTADPVLTTIANALGVRDAGDRSIIEAIGLVLGNTTRLIVVDNFEHVMGAAACLAEILSVTSGVRILVTSRQPLHLRWEREYPLLPLDVPDEKEQLGVDAIASASAVELFVQRAHRVRPDFSLTAENSAAVAAIARRLDGLPLALELAAARLRVLAPDELLRRLERRLDALGGSARDAPGRHRTLREAITWSHDLLREDEQRFFRRLGVFAGGATLEAIETVCSGDGIDVLSVLDLLDGLVDKSLVVSTTDATTGQMRFQLLETIREYAMELLVAAGEADAVFDRHLAWAVALADRGWTEIWGPNAAAWFDLLDREHDNLRLALDHAAGAGNATLGLEVAHCLWPFWDVRGHYREGQRRLQQLLSLADDAPSLARGRSLDALGWLTTLLGDYERGYELLQQGLAMVRETGTPADLSWSLGEQGNVAFTLGLGPEARALFSEGLDIARELDDLFLIGWHLFGLAYCDLLDGDVSGMEDKLRQALELSRRRFQPWGIAWAQFSLGVVAIMNGQPAAAVPPVIESLELRASIRDARGITESLGVLAALASILAGATDPVDLEGMRWSARLHGANELQLEANGLTVFPFLQPLHDESMARVVAALGQAEVDRLGQEGRAAPVDKIVAEALAWGHEFAPAAVDPASA